MGSARPGFVRNAVGSLALLGIVAFIAFGLPSIDRSLPSNRAVAGDVPFAVGADVTVVPPSGARVDLTRTRPDNDRGTTLFVLDGVRYAVVAGPFHGTLADAASRLRRKITKSAGFQVTGGERGVRTAGGVDGVRGTYSSPGRLGQYAVFLRGGLVVEVTASGPEDQLRADSAALDASLRTISFGGRRS